MSAEPAPDRAALIAESQQGPARPLRCGMKTVGLLLVTMIVASVYVFDVAGARRPMSDAGTAVLTELQQAVRDLRARVPDAG